MNGQELDGLIKRYLEGSCNPSEAALVEKIYTLSGKKRGSIALLNKHEEQALEKRLQKNINAHAVNNASVSKGRSIKLWSLAVAASLLILVSIGFFLFDQRPSVLTAQIEQNENPDYVNESLTDQRITLSDGSFVTLKPKSTLHVSFNLQESLRIVFLDGEAFFDVAPNKEKPFLVYTQNVVTKVLGTSFNVKAFRKDDDVKVTVVEGKVSVTAQNDARPKDDKEIILLPNQEAVVNKASQNVLTKLVDNPVLVNVEQFHSSMKFEDVPAAEILKTLAIAYNIEMIFDASKFQQCKLTSTFVDESLFDRLNIICTAIGATYKKVDTQIVFTNPQCFKK